MRNGIGRVNHEKHTSNVWWFDEEHLLFDVSDDEYAGVTKMYGRKIEGIWEYALVNWHCHTPNIIKAFADGVVTTIESE